MADIDYYGNVTPSKGQTGSSDPNVQKQITETTVKYGGFSPEAVAERAAQVASSSTSTPEQKAAQDKAILEANRNLFVTSFAQTGLREGFENRLTEAQAIELGKAPIGAIVDIQRAVRSGAVGGYSVVSPSTGKTEYFLTSQAADAKIEEMNRLESDKQPDLQKQQDINIRDSFLNKQSYREYSKGLIFDPVIGDFHLDPLMSGITKEEKASRLAEISGKQYKYIDEKYKANLTTGLFVGTKSEYDKYISDVKQQQITHKMASTSIEHLTSLEYKIEKSRSMILETKLFGIIPIGSQNLWVSEKILTPPDIVIPTGTKEIGDIYVGRNPLTGARLLGLGAGGVEEGAKWATIQGILKDDYTKQSGFYGARQATENPIQFAAELTLARHLPIAISRGALLQRAPGVIGEIKGATGVLSRFASSTPAIIGMTGMLTIPPTVMYAMAKTEEEKASIVGSTTLSFAALSAGSLLVPGFGSQILKGTGFETARLNIGVKELGRGDFAATMEAGGIKAVESMTSSAKLKGLDPSGRPISTVFDDPLIAGYEGIGYYTPKRTLVIEKPFTENIFVESPITGGRYQVNIPGKEPLSKIDIPYSYGVNKLYTTQYFDLPTGGKIPKKVLTEFSAEPTTRYYADLSGKQTIDIINYGGFGRTTKDIIPKELSQYIMPREVPKTKLEGKIMKELKPLGKDTSLDTILRITEKYAEPTMKIEETTVRLGDSTKGAPKDIVSRAKKVLRDPITGEETRIEGSFAIENPTAADLDLASVAKLEFVSRTGKGFETYDIKTGEIISASRSGFSIGGRSTRVLEKISGRKATTYESEVDSMLRMREATGYQRIDRLFVGHKAGDVLPNPETVLGYSVQYRTVKDVTGVPKYAGAEAVGQNVAAVKGWQRATGKQIIESGEAPYFKERFGREIQTGETYIYQGHELGSIKRIGKLEFAMERQIELIKKAKGSEKDIKSMEDALSRYRTEYKVDLAKKVAIDIKAKEIVDITPIRTKSSSGKVIIKGESSLIGSLIKRHSSLLPKSSTPKLSSLGKSSISSSLSSSLSSLGKSSISSSLSSSLSSKSSSSSSSRSSSSSSRSSSSSSSSLGMGRTPPIVIPKLGRFGGEAGGGAVGGGRGKRVSGEVFKNPMSKIKASDIEKLGFGTLKSVKQVKQKAQDVRSFNLGNKPISKIGKKSKKKEFWEE